MASENESIESIVAEMRTRSREVKEAFGGRPDGVENMLDIWAERIEAVAKRERALVGNAAAMRSALGKIVELAKEWWNHDYDPAITLGLIIDRAGAALSAPARNCDLCDSYGDAIRAFEDTEDAEEYEDMAEWLLAPAEERKGDCDGR